MNHIPDTRLDELLTQKAFAVLTAEEKAYVLAFITEQEYNQCHFIARQASSALLTNYADLQPSPKTLQTLSAAFHAQQQGGKLPLSTTSAKAHYWYMAIAASVLLVVGFFAMSYLAGKKTYSPIVYTKHTGPKQNALAQHRLATVQASKVSKPLAIKHTPLTKVGSIGPDNTNQQDLCKDVSINFARIPDFNASTSTIPGLTTMTNDIPDDTTATAN